MTGFSFRGISIADAALAVLRLEFYIPNPYMAYIEVSVSRGVARVRKRVSIKR